MENKVLYIETEVTITFSTGTSVIVDMNEELANYLESINLVEEFSTSSSNPVGIVSSNVLKITLISTNKSLVPSYKSSPYYGYMDNTSYISIRITKMQYESGVVTVDIPLGKFFVDKWANGASYGDTNTVSIETVDLLNNIKKTNVPLLGAKRGELLSAYLLRLITKINEDDSRDGIYDINCNTLSFGEFDANCRMYNLDTTTMDNLLNQISQGTLTNIFMGRDAKLTTDYIFDDTASSSVCTLTTDGDDYNITDITAEDSSIKAYSGVCITYNIGSVQESSEVASLSDQQVGVTPLDLNSITFNDSLYKVNAISVIGTLEDITVAVDKFSYNNKSCDLTISSISAQPCGVKLYGQTLSNTEKKTDVVYVDKTGEVLQLTNDVVAESNITLFRGYILELMQSKKDSFIVTGYFSPEIKLGDIVTLVSADLGINDTYKVFSIELSITGSYESRLKLIKTLT